MLSFAVSSLDSNIKSEEDRILVSTNLHERAYTYPGCVLVLHTSTEWLQRCDALDRNTKLRLFVPRSSHVYIKTQ